MKSASLTTRWAGRLVLFVAMFFAVPHIEASARHVTPTFDFYSGPVMRDGPAPIQKDAPQCIMFGAILSMSPGGLAGYYQGMVNALNDAELPVCLNGTFWSGGTLFLGIRKVCVTQQSMFWFHAATNSVTLKVSSVSATMLAYQLLPPQVLQVVADGIDFHDSNSWLGISGEDLIRYFGILECATRPTPPTPSSDVTQTD